MTTRSKTLQLAALKAVNALGLEAGHLDPEAQRAIVEVYVRLHGLMGGDRANMAHWVSTPNKHLAGVPAELLTTPGGRERVLAYLDRVANALKVVDH